MKDPVLHIHPRDNVAVALADLVIGQTANVGGHAVKLSAAIGRGHKFALRPIAKGENILKFGQPIGHATVDIPPGAKVHVHNVKTNLEGVLEYSYEPKSEKLPSLSDGLTFDGYHRSDGDIGIRNEIWILPTVGCVNEVAQAIRRRVLDEGLPEGVDGIHVYAHPYGCSQLGGDHENTQRILADLARHPNAGGVLIVGLGCENNTMASFRHVLGSVDPLRYRFLVAQEYPDEVAAGVVMVKDLVAHAAAAVRQPTPISRLRVGLKCGGSDGFSGITGNPLVGAFSDRLIARGGTSVLTEVPEMFGAEALFMNRCESREVFDACVAMINGFKEYFRRYHQVVYENPSPGNKDGGITTLEEKSLGCLQKGGTSTVVDILPYGGRVQKHGLNFLTGPGNDIVSCTAMSAAGAHLILFTTGRGTPLGAPVPTLKIATNSELAARKASWVDFDAGQLLEGRAMGELADQLLAHVLDVASGRKLTRNEENGFREIAIFKDGVTL
ncbi:MAG TPA: altronate dehydratase family protein [Candidatus Didemnitutus sp.]|nr:altronate dehydratase family protein [Candidatus Didemnitutus sp.]